MLKINLYGNSSSSIANSTAGILTVCPPMPNRSALHLGEIKKLSRLDFHYVSEIKGILQTAFLANQKTLVEHMKRGKSWRQHIGWSLCSSQHPAA